jgi:hypothetical protein
VDDLPSCVMLYVTSLTKKPVGIIKVVNNITEDQRVVHALTNIQYYLLYAISISRTASRSHPQEVPQ